jgi:hypothetical protein
VGLLAGSVPQLSDLERGQEMGVAGQDAEFTFGARCNHLVHLPAEQQLVGCDDL